jgi:predicted fused transcriptional regulator/phosphomethylpyrimidine kinase
VLALSPENLHRTLESIGSSFTEDDISGVFLNIRYQNQLLSLTTGISYKIFSVDKTLDAEWDRLVKQFLKQHEISFSEL